jgi:hypothetical protein
MAYIGRQPSYGAFEKQDLTPDSSTTTFSLTYVVGSSSSILVSVAGVVQEPEVGYTISGGGANIVFTEAPTTGDNVYVQFLGFARDVAQFNSGVITAQTEESTVADDDLILVYDASATALRKMTKANFAPTVTLTYNTRSATGDGSTQGFTVTSGVTVDDVLVSINGVIQRPTSDYTVSGTTLTFSTAPEASDAISIRELPREG